MNDTPAIRELQLAKQIQKLLEKEGPLLDPALQDVSISLKKYRQDHDIKRLKQRLEELKNFFRFDPNTKV
jgi:hypothetical protein